MEFLDIKSAREKLDKKEISSVELTKIYLERIKNIDNKIKACLTVCEEEALREAEEADKRMLRGEKNDLLGIPYLAKDNILTKNIRTTAASRILENYIAPFDATVIKKLKEKGAVLLGKTNLDEFAHGASTENSAFGPTHNPWDLERVPGGSSGGSGAAVAAGMCVFALGTDTGGSIRCPASFCGVVGLKPSYGRSSRFGLIAMTSSTDVPGPLTRTVEDAVIVLNAIQGVDKYDSTTIKSEEIRENDYKVDDLKGFKIGLPKEYFGEGIDEDVKRAIEDAIEVLKKNGAEIKEVTLPHTKYAVPVYYIITPSEISSNLARFDGIRYGFSAQNSESLFDLYARTRGEGFGPEVKRRIMLGTYALSAGYYDAYYLKAQKVRTRIKQEMDDALKEVDILLTPTSPHVAFRIGEQQNDPLKMYLEDIFVTSPSLAGLPAISIPIGFSKEEMPIGMQLIGPRLGEGKIFKVAYLYQKETEWHTKKPSL